MINEEQLKLMSEKPGFVAALDQSLSSTPAALRAYGIPDDTYHTKEEMLDLIHDIIC
jgi:fructose-bisphosphate aldolase class I